MYTNATLEQILIDLNEAEVERLVPLILFLVVIVITGIPGNFLVCLVYWKNFRESNSKFFILCLAASDFLSCFVVILEIANVAQQFTYTNEWLCKSTIFFETWLVMTSGYLLCVISVDRYRKVCHPFSWQITNKAARIVVGVGTFIALMCAWPAFILYGIKDVATPTHNTTGTECGILIKYHETVTSKLYNGTLWIIFVTALCLLAILYTLITRKLLNQPKKTQTTLKGKDDPSTDARESSVDMIEPESVSTSSAFQPGWRNIKAAMASSMSSIRKSSVQVRSSSSTNSQQRRTSAQSRTMKSAYIMGLISIVFVCSFLPYLTLRLLEALDKNFVDSLSDGGRAAHKGILRSYFLNCAINPFIYCACSTYFRRDLLIVLRKMCECNIR